MAARKSFSYKLAMQITDLLGLPLNSHGDPAKGIQILRACTSAMREALKRGEEIEVRGFGKFIITGHSGRRTGSNFVSSDGIKSPVPMEHRPKKYVKFIPGEQLRAMLNKGTSWDEKRAMEIWNK